MLVMQLNKNLKIKTSKNKHKIMEVAKKTRSLIDLTDIIEKDIEEHKSQLCFRESLIISKFENEAQETPNPVGGMCLDVQAALDNKIVIYVSTKFNVDDASGGSKISTWIDQYFYTIEEKRVEFIYGKESEKQSLYIGTEKDGMLVSHLLNERERTTRKYASTITRNLITEGANFVIMRLLAVCLYEGKFEMTAMYINGDLCRNIYVCSGSIPATINNVKTKIVKVLRTIIEQCGIVHECSTILTSDGHIVKQEWNKCAYVIQLNPLQDPIALAISGAACGCDNVLSLVAGWQNDMELMSIYLDRRTMCEYRAKDYLDDTPEVSNILTDYVKTLLQHKPEKVLEFTSDYFIRYGN